MSSHIRVLLADDHPLVRAGLRELLDATPDIQVVGEAGDGQAAVELTAALRPDLVVMDIHMPKVSGIAATRPCRRLVKCGPISANSKPTGYADGEGSGDAQPNYPGVAVLAAWQ